MSRPALLTLAFAGLAAATAADPPKPDPPAGTPQDVVYFAKGGPVRVRFRVVIGGKPAEAAWQAAADKLFAYCDRDGNGTLDAKERAALNRPGRQQPGFVDLDEDGNPVAAGAGLQLFAEKDAPADKAAFAAKLRAGKLGPVEVVIQPAGAEAERLTQALFTHLDRDRDGKLSAGELTAAADRFAALDLNEDDLISGPELRGTAVASAGNNVLFARPRQEPDGDDAPTDELFALPNGSAAAVKAVLAARDKDKSGSLNRAEFGADPKAFAGLDRDGNAQLDTDEVAAWLRSPPDLEVAVAFGGPKPADGPAKALADARLRVTYEAGAASAAADGWKRTADRMRAEFDRLAKDKKAVERKQIEGPNARDGRALLPVFDFADRNADKVLTKDELDAAVAAVGAVAACRAEVTLVDQGRGLFELIDRNGDGQFSPRELRSAAELVKDLDRDGDGRVATAEVPRLFPAVVAPAGLPVVTLPQQRVVRPAIRPEPAARSAGPGWFAKMDRNGDGDVSAREFLGPAELFRKLDRDGDGLLSPDEAQVAK